MSNVKHIAFVRKDNGEITSLMFSKASNNPPEGTDANDSNLEVVYITDVIERGDVFIQSKYRDFDNSVWLDRDSKPNSVSTWNGTAWTYTEEDVLELVRAERNRRLVQTDWTQFEDNGLSDSVKASWVTYRQELRDVTTQVDSDTVTIADITWPTSP